jgi:hypothetical protein
MKHRLPIFPAIFVGIVGAVVAGLYLARHRHIEPVEDAVADQVPARSTATSGIPPSSRENLVPAPRAGEIIGQAARQLASHDTVLAKINLHSEVFGESLTAVGQYLQGPPDSRRVRLELKLKLGDKVCSLQQVSDGNAIWCQQTTLKTSRLGRVDLQRALAAMQQSGFRTGVDVLALGGLSILLDSLNRSFEFQTMRSEKLGAVPTYVVLGVWKPKALAQLIAGDEPAPEGDAPLDLGQVPEYLPNQIEVYVGRDDLFPYQVDYLRAAHPGNRHDRDRLLARMKFVDVHFDKPIDPGNFVNPGGNTVPVDDTEAYLRRVIRK